ncbi:MAG TPA: HAMP domain-containing sensor histidine kinase [Stenomitos sp.]
MRLNLPLKAIPKAWLIKQIATPLKKNQTNIITDEYKDWRHRFLLERLHLAAWITLIAYPTFLIMSLFAAATVNATGDPRDAVSQAQILTWLIDFAATELCVLLCLTLLRIKKARCYPEILFLGLSWSITLLSQIQATFRGEAQLDTLSWFMMFPIQATLIPVRWTLHLVSQVGAVGYYFSMNLVFGLVDPDIKRIPLSVVNAQVALIFFWLCFICNLGVYLYERLQQREFESHQQLRVFLHAVSHDLRNPVLGIVMVLRNLLKQPGEKVSVSRSILERIADSSDRQLDLINSLIETHAAEVRGVVVHCQPLQLNLLVQSAIADLQPMLTKEQATLINFIPNQLSLVNADPLQLSRVYQNLIANALNHNPPGLSIKLDAKLDGDWVRCTVMDNGVGMSPQQCEKLFDLYFRGDQKRQSVGLGLGLYLCRQIITAHGGDIGVNSGLGEGTTFWFKLPLAVLPPLSYSGGIAGSSRP